MLMSCLSVRSPWSYLIHVGFKHLENRDWRTLPKMRGLVAIHTGQAPWRFEKGEEADLDRRGVPLQGWRDLPRGVVAGVSELTGAYKVEDLPRPLRDRWDANGPVCLILRPKYLLKVPMPLKGQLGFWSIDIPEANLVPIVRLPRLQPSLAAMMGFAPVGTSLYDAP